MALLKNEDDIEAYFEKNIPDLHSLYPCLPMHEHNWALSLVPIKQLQAWKKLKKGQYINKVKNAQEDNEKVPIEQQCGCIEDTGH